MIDYDKVILDICGGTGAWSKPYKDAGYTVYNITLPEYNLMKCWKMEGEKGKFLMFRKESKERPFGPPFHLKIDISKVYGILVAPPCTHFSFARQNTKTSRDIPGAFELVKKCREIIEACALYGNLKFWCLENPRGYLAHILGKPCFIFKPCEFGNPTNKITYLWGRFNFPKKLKNSVPVPKRKNRESKGYPVTGTKWKRAITPPGFANAFFLANR